MLWKKRDVIVYRIQQSFKLEELEPEEVKKVGYELAMRFTKGKYAFIIATNIDGANIHNHIIFNSTSMDGTRKFRYIVCLEQGLSVIKPNPFAERVKQVLFLKKKSQCDILCEAIDGVLSNKLTEYIV